jgi:hypothetical protein
MYFDSRSVSERCKFSLTTVSPTYEILFAESLLKIVSSKTLPIAGLLFV